MTHRRADAHVVKYAELALLGRTLHIVVVLGEDDVLSPAIDSGRGAIVWYWKQNVDGHRDLGVSIVCNYTTVTGLNRRGHMLQCFIMPQHVHHGFSGREFQARYSLHNDLLAPSEFDFRWSLADSQGTVVTGGPPNFGGGGIPHLIMVSSRPESVLHTTGAGKSGNTPGIGGRLPA